MKQDPGLCSIMSSRTAKVPALTVDKITLAGSSLDSGPQGGSVGSAAFHVGRRKKQVKSPIDRDVGRWKRMSAAADTVDRSFPGPQTKR